LGQLFENLCKGPVVVIDDMIGVGKDLINMLIEEIKNRNLPVLQYTNIPEVRKLLGGLLFCNFILLDWKMVGGKEGIPPEVQIGAEAEIVSEREVIEFIKEIQKVSLAPIFVVSNYDTGEITSKLEGAGIDTSGKAFVFVESKNALCGTKGALISKIETWIKDSPHVYLAKWWTNEWLSNNTRVFWDLCESNPDWPAWFYHSFKEDGDEPVLALRDTLFQLILSDIDVSSIDESLLDKKVRPNKANWLDSLKELYVRLVYTKNNIDKDIRPGDIFRIEENNEKKYYLNIRPECDTTKRTPDPKLYLLEGTVKTPGELRNRYDKKYGIIEQKPEVIMLLLDGNDIVRFDKRELFIKTRSELEQQGYEKIYRVVSPFITQYRQSYTGFLGRFGVPSYPKQIIDSIFQPKKVPPEA